MKGQKSCLHSNTESFKILGTHGKMERCTDCGKYLSTPNHNVYRAKRRNKVRKALGKDRIL